MESGGSKIAQHAPLDTAVFELGLNQPAWQSDLADLAALQITATECNTQAPLNGLILAQGVLRLGPTEALTLSDWHHGLSHNATAGMSAAKPSPPCSHPAAAFP